MSHPCFALSVMLCCMAGPLLIIGKTHARDTVVSPIHDPGECIVCPVAHGPLEVCGGYSDYDCNEYWYDGHSPPTPEATTQAEPGLKVASSLTDDSAEEAWESSYEDYYADYVFGDDSPTTDAEDPTSEQTPDPAAVIDAASEAASTPDGPQGEETSDLSEPASEAYSDEIIDADLLNDTWGDEETWYREEYGYGGALDEENAEVSADLEPEGPLETGYDEAYDEAMAMDSEPVWLTELVNRILAPIRTATEGIASSASIPDRDARTANYVDVCAQEWDCESDYWAQPQAEQPSVVLSAAETLEGMAAVLQNAAEFLRGVAGGHLAETAQAKGGATR